jgi:hypothetical protein
MFELPLTSCCSYWGQNSYGATRKTMSGVIFTFATDTGVQTLTKGTGKSPWPIIAKYNLAHQRRDFC